MLVLWLGEEGMIGGTGPAGVQDSALPPGVHSQASSRRIRSAAWLGKAGVRAATRRSNWGKSASPLAGDVPMAALTQAIAWEGHHIVLGTAQMPPERAFLDPVPPHALNEPRPEACFSGSAAVV